MAAPKTRLRIGDMLVQQGVITEAQLKEALDRQKQTRQKLGKTLVSLGYVKEKEFLTFLSKQLAIKTVVQTGARFRLHPHPEAHGAIGPELAGRYRHAYRLALIGHGPARLIGPGGRAYGDSKINQIEFGPSGPTPVTHIDSAIHDPGFF